MPGDRRTNMEIAKQDTIISEMYLEGRTQAEIAEAIGKSQPTISRAIRRIHERWLASPLVNFNEAKMRELAAIDRVEQAAWEAFEASREAKAVRTTTGSRDKPSTATVRNEDQNGDAQFLNVVLKCSKQRSDLLGLIVQRTELAEPGQGGGKLDSMTPFFRLMGQKERTG
jgi:ParB-like chromosome segregation protein Spo0J